MRGFCDSSINPVRNQVVSRGLGTYLHGLLARASLGSREGSRGGLLTRLWGLSLRRTVSETVHSLKRLRACRREISTSNDSSSQMHQTNAAQAQAWRAFLSWLPHVCKQSRGVQPVVCHYPGELVLTILTDCRAIVGCEKMDDVGVATLVCREEFRVVKSKRELCAKSLMRREAGREICRLAFGHVQHHVMKHSALEATALCTPAAIA